MIEHDQAAIGFDQLPGHWIRKLQQLAVSVVGGRLADAGIDLTPVQFATLSALEKHEGIDQIGLAAIVALDRTTMSGVLGRLETKDLLRREMSPTDRRARVLRLTPEGAAKARLAAVVVAQAQGSLFEGLDDAQREQFLDTLRLVVERGENGGTRATEHAE